MLLNCVLCRIVARTVGVDCFRNSYYTLDTITLLINCLDNVNIAEAAAETLVCGFIRDTQYHMEYFEHPHAAPLATGQSSNIVQIVNIMHKASPVVQAHLTNLLSVAIKYDKTHGLLKSLLSSDHQYMTHLVVTDLKSDFFAAQDAGIAALMYTLQSLVGSADLKPYFGTFSKELIDYKVVELMVKFTLNPDYPLDSPSMAHILTILEILSENPASHTSLLAYASLHGTVGGGSGGDGNHSHSARSGTTHSSTALIRVTDALAFLLSEGSGALTTSVTPADAHFHLLTQCLHIVYNVVSQTLSHTAVPTFVRTNGKTLLSPCVLVLCNVKFFPVVTLAVNILHRYIHYFGCMDLLMQMDAAGEFVINAVIDALCQQILIPVDSFAAIHSAIGGVHGDDSLKVNLAIDTLALVLYQLYSYQQLNSSSTNSAIIMFTMESAYMKIITDSAIWSVLMECFHAPYLQMAAAARLIHLLACYKNIRTLNELHHKLEEHQVFNVLCYLVCYGNNSAEDNETLLLTVGSIAGKAVSLRRWGLPYCVLLINCRLRCLLSVGGSFDCGGSITSCDWRGSDHRTSQTAAPSGSETSQSRLWRQSTAPGG